MNTPADVFALADDAQVMVDTLEALEKTLAPYAARYGRFGDSGTWDHDRKVLLATCATDVRTTAQERQVKMTEAAIDEAARQHEAYVRFLDNALAERTTQAELLAQQRALLLRIEFAKALVYAHTKLAGVQ